jgi:hypothetical protein
MQNTTKTVLIVIGLLGVLALGYIVFNKNASSSAPVARRRMMASNSGMVPPIKAGIETFESQAPSDQVSISSGMQAGGMPTQAYSVDASENIGLVEQPQGLQQPSPMTMNPLPSECYPKDVLSSADLLPRDANSLWAQVNPSGQGSLADQNFLTAGFHIGINTVGQTLRNANRQLRSEPLNPQVKVSPWMQTTIEPDINRRPLEIQGDL